LKQNRWNGADGKPYSKICIVAEHVEFRPETNKGAHATHSPSPASIAAVDDMDFDGSEGAPVTAEELEAVTF
jgi:hypothetical protein